MQIVSPESFTHAGVRAEDWRLLITALNQVRNGRLTSRNESIPWLVNVEYRREQLLSSILPGPVNLVAVAYCKYVDRCAARQRCGRIADRCPRLQRKCCKGDGVELLIVS